MRQRRLPTVDIPSYDNNGRRRGWCRGRFGCGGGRCRGGGRARCRGGNCRCRRWRGRCGQGQFPGDVHGKGLVQVHVRLVGEDVAALHRAQADVLAGAYGQVPGNELAAGLRDGQLSVGRLGVGEVLDGGGVQVAVVQELRFVLREDGGLLYRVQQGHGQNQGLRLRVVNAVQQDRDHDAPDPQYARGQLGLDRQGLDEDEVLLAVRVVGVVLLVLVRLVRPVLHVRGEEAVQGGVR